MAYPTPKADLVLRYAYLWADQHAAGADTGKDRPCLIALVLGAAPTVYVLPITHSIPTVSGQAVEIPQAVKQHLSLDHERSFIIVSECNAFIWPGVDLRPVPKKNGCDYGFVPPRLFRAVIEQFIASVKAAKVATTFRQD